MNNWDKFYMFDFNRYDISNRESCIQLYKNLVIILNAQLWCFPYFKLFIFFPSAYCGKARNGLDIDPMAAKRSK